MTNISDWAFRDCLYLTSIKIPDSVERIGKRAFSNCESLTSILIPESVMKISKSSFRCCYNLTIQPPTGSYAQQWAEEHRFKYEIVPSKAERERLAREAK